MSKKYFFIGVAGAGMSAIAQYLSNTGNIVYGSDRLFVNEPEHQIRKQLENENIKTFLQGEAKISDDTDFVVVSTAIENSVPEYKQALELNIPVIHRSEILKKITHSKKTVAVSGTSGKSTTTAMLYTILDENGKGASMINGSGLVKLQKQGKIGNCAVGNGDWLVIEADESDGTLVNYSPEIGLLLNIDRDHKEFDELEKIFNQFISQVKDQVIVNCGNERSKVFSKSSKFDFGTEKNSLFAQNILQTPQGLSFRIQNTDFFIPVIGLHNVENSLAAISVASYLGISLENCSTALKNYQGIDRRMQIIGEINGTVFIDDYAHNPAKICSAIKTAQVLSKKVIAFFQPHGFAPLKFFKDELIETIAKQMRNDDEMYFSEVFFAGGTVNKTITSAEIVDELNKKGVKTFLSEPRDIFAEQIKNKIQKDVIILIMGARDPSLSNFSKMVFEENRENH